MTRGDSLKCVHEPFGDAFYFGPERLSERFQNDEAARLKSGFSQTTYKTVMDRLGDDASEVRPPRFANGPAIGPNSPLSIMVSLRDPSSRQAPVRLFPNSPEPRASSCRDHPRLCRLPWRMWTAYTRFIDPPRVGGKLPG